MVVAAAVAALVVGVGLTVRSALTPPGNAAVWHDPADKWSCGSAHPTIAPAPVTRGQSIAVSSGNAHCARKLPDAASFAVTLGSDASAGARTSARASVHPDGSFTVSLTVPADFPLGEAWVAVDDSAYVPCHDTNQSMSQETTAGMRLASCAGAMTRFLVTG